MADNLCARLSSTHEIHLADRPGGLTLVASKNCGGKISSKLVSVGMAGGVCVCVCEGLVWLIGV